MRWVVLVVLAACGRVGFDATATGDAPAIDSLIPTDGPPANLLVYLPFDDDPSDGADNQGSVSDTGVCAPSCPTSVAGKRGNAFRFDTGMGIRIPHDPRLELQEGTLAAWFLLDALPATNEHNVIGGMAYSDTGSNTFELFVYDDGLGAFLESGGDANMFGTGGPYVFVPWAQVGVWTHVAMTWTAGQMQRLVVNGTTVQTDFTFTATYDMHDLMIGCDEEPVGLTHYWQGAIDDVVLVDRQLTDAEIQLLVMLGS